MAALRAAPSHMARGTVPALGFASRLGEGEPGRFPGRAVARNVNRLPSPASGEGRGGRGLACLLCCRNRAAGSGDRAARPLTPALSRGRRGRQATPCGDRRFALGSRARGLHPAAGEGGAMSANLYQPPEVLTCRSQPAPVIARSVCDVAIQNRRDRAGGPWIAASQVQIAVTAPACPVKAPRHLA